MLNLLDLSSDDDLRQLEIFSKLDHPNTFRYFKTREFKEAIKTHVLTLMYSTYGYAHIDKDIQSNRYYLGLCVMPEYQRRGIGTKLLDMIFKLHKDDTYLTVDKENISAIYLYEKYGFKRIVESETTYTYKRPKPLFLEVSVGESVDKLTILDIKLEKIKDEAKRDSCQREYDSIYKDVKDYIDTCPRFYKWLKYINLQIWNLQDEIRERNNYSNETFHKILDLNDMRFRVKHRINALYTASFQEQKGYSNKTGIFVTHLGLGDLICMNGAIRYCALMVDKLYVFCKERNMKNIVEMFADDPTIVLLQCRNDDSDVYHIIQNPSLRISETVTHKFLSGTFVGRNVYQNPPTEFYDDLKIPYEVKHIFVHINCSSMLPIPTVPYIFTHATSSFNGDLHFEKKWDINKILTIDPNKNYYTEDHVWYTIANDYLNRPLLSYMDIISHADEIHVSESSFYCLACFIPLSAKKKLCYDRTSQLVRENYTFH